MAETKAHLKVKHVTMETEVKVLHNEGIVIALHNEDCGDSTEQRRARQKHHRRLRIEDVTTEAEA